MVLPAAPAAPVHIEVLRARKHDKRSEAEELRMEIVAAGQEMVAMATRITSAVVSEDWHSALHFASRLAVLGRGYTNGGSDDAA